jgi:hypothetical protein
MEFAALAEKERALISQRKTTRIDIPIRRMADDVPRPPRAGLAFMGVD